MTLPNWKKSRLVRVSRLLADLHCAPPKHGSSLLLHTGFPTSLLDLFLKNRDRFNKGGPPGSSPRRHYQQLVLAVPPPTSSLMTVDHHHHQASSGGNKILFLGLFKVFVILGFGLSAAQFAWAMAAAAFSLLSLELLGKYSRSYSGGDCNSEPRRENQGIVASNSGLIDVDRYRRLQESSAPVIKGSADSVSTAADKKITRTDDTAVTDQQRREPRSKPNLIKKLMMKKKLRHGKKREQTNPAVMAADVDEDIIISQGSGKPQVVEDDKETTISEGRRSEIVLDGNRNQQTGKISCYANHQYSILMVMVIVLSGLIVGRIPALLVTVSWCLILRYVD